MIRTKRVKEPRASEDGTRVLVMRLWPRGVKKTHVDAWERDLAPPVELLRGLNSGAVPWATFAREYREHVRKAGEAKLAEIRERSASGETITLLCWCPDETRCHRSLLHALLAEKD